MNGSMASHLFDQLPRGYRLDRRFGPIYTRPPSGADDLTCIRGINTREAVILNRLGIYFLAQIALWDQYGIAAFAEELGMQQSTLRNEQWVQQAQARIGNSPPQPSLQHRNLPASFIRTISLLACAVLIGFMLVFWLSTQTEQPLQGTLSADITSLRVPADSRLVASHVRAGDEVFSGDALLTLEKTEHLTMISLQEQRVRELERDLRKAEAQASLDLEWRTRELDRELSDVRTRAHLIQEVKRTPVEPYRSAALPNKSLTVPVASSRVVSSRPSPNSMVFISESGETSFEAGRPAPLAIPPETKMVLASEPTSAEEMLSVEARSVESRLQRLEELRAILPEQVRQAAGVEGIRIQLQDASSRLDEMQTLSRNVAVVCPAYGKVGQVRYKSGDHMSHGEVMLKILHTDRRFVMAFVPTRRLNEIEPGTIVDVVFPGNRRCRGKISNLPMLAETPVNGGQSLASVRVEPVGRLWPEIPIGSQIDVVIGEKRIF